MKTTKLTINYITNTIKMDGVKDNLTLSLRCYHYYFILVLYKDDQEVIEAFEFPEDTTFSLDENTIFVNLSGSGRGSEFLEQHLDKMKKYDLCEIKLDSKKNKNTDDDDDDEE